jgi:Uma2 family endonuclease
MTYEEYLAEGETNWRYSIIDGVRHDMTAPIWRHQRIQQHVSRAFVDFEERSGVGLTVAAPTDVLIRRSPLQVRQPDVLFISHAALAAGGGPPASGPLTVAPELVVEILSQSDTRRGLQGKIADYREIGVQECWVVDADNQTIEVLRLDASGAQSSAVHPLGRMAASRVFPELAVAVSAVFAA